MDFVTDNINNFNKAITNAITGLTQKPEDFSSGIYELVKNINEALVPLAMALLLTYFIFSFYENAVTFKMQDYKVYVTGIINLMIGVTILNYNLDILNIFYEISNTILRKISFFSTSTAMIIDADKIITLWEGVDIWSGAALFFESLFCQMFLVIILFIAQFVITFVILARMFEIYAYMAFAPIAMCSFVSNSTSNIGKGYITNFCVVVLKSSVIVLILEMYQTYLVDQASTMADSGFGYFWGVAISGLLMITLIIGAEKISQKVIGSLK